MRLFVSYARVDKPSCEPIIHELEKAHEVFYDQRLHVGERWRAEIERWVSWCEGFVYMLTPESVASEYCQWEYGLAREGEKLIFPVLLQADTDIPKELREIQIADFSDGLTAQAFSDLSAGIHRAEVDRLRQTIPRAEAPPAAPQVDMPHGWDALTAGLAALDAGRLDEALFKLRQAHESGYDFGAYVNLERVIAETEARLERAAYERRAELSYAPIVQLVSIAALCEQGCEAFARFRQEFPDYDPQGVAGRCESHRQQQARAAAKRKPVAPSGGARPAAPLPSAPRLNKPRAIIIAAVIAGVLGIVGLIIEASGGFGPRAAETPVAANGDARPQETAAPTESLVVGATGRSPQPTATPKPTATMRPPTDTPAPSATPDPIPTLALKGVSSNVEWAPYIQEFDGAPMALVPAGCFLMGSEDGESDEQPVHEVCFSEPFWIDVYEVTNAQFQSFGGEAGRESNWTDDDRPRESITWFEAVAFCERRGARLPTEAEWEYAARGPDGLVYPWGNEFIANNVVYGDNSGGHTWDVGSRPGGVSWVGALDMSGNVWEWVNSLYRFYPYSATDGREVDGNSNGSSWRVVRGGSWHSGSYYLRAAYRLRNFPGYTYVNDGFRCARSY